MAHYVYKFINKNDEVVYVGRTSQSMKQRMEGHFNGHGHLPSECYKNATNVEYCSFSTKVETEIVELYLINKIKPVFNTMKKEDGQISLEMKIAFEWKTYEGFKNREEHEKDLLRQKIYDRNVEVYNLKENVSKLNEENIELKNEISNLNIKLEKKNISILPSYPINPDEDSTVDMELIKIDSYNFKEFKEIYSNKELEEVVFYGDILANGQICERILVEYKDSTIFYSLLERKTRYTHDMLNDIGIKEAFDKIWINMVSDNGFKTNANIGQRNIIEDIISKTKDGRHAS